MPTPDLVDALSSLGALGLAIFAVLGFVAGYVRPGKLVDAERTRILAERDARESSIVADRDRREAKLAEERDAWRERALAGDERLDRFATAFERIAGRQAPE